MNTISRIYELLKSKDFFYPMCAFIGTLLYTFLTSHMFSMFNIGYLRYFKIDASYPIDSLLSHPKAMMFIFVTIIIAFISTVVYIIYFYIKEKLDASQNLNWCCISCKFFFLFVLLCILIAISFSVLLIYCLTIYNNVPIWDILCILVQQDDFICTVFILSLYLTIVLLLSFLMSHSSKEKSDNDHFIKKLINSNKRNHLAFICVLLALVLGIYSLDKSALDFGKLSASMEQSYPSFTENQTEYIIIAKSYDNNFLVIEVDSLKTNNVKCIIKNIEGYELTNKFTSDFPL